MKAPEPWPEPPDPPGSVEFTKFTRVDGAGGAWTDMLTGRAYRTLDQLVEARKKRVGKGSVAKGFMATLGGRALRYEATFRTVIPACPAEAETILPTEEV